MKNVNTIVAGIRENVDLFWNRQRSYEDFCAENGRLWDKARALGIENKVSDIVVKDIKK